MHKRLLASLIVCVALLTQIGASFSGAAIARDGFPWCHKKIAASAVGQAQSPDKSAPSGAHHDHGSCSLCQIGLDALDAPVVLSGRPVAFAWRVALAEPEAPAPRPAFNRSALARAPPSHV